MHRNIIFFLVFLLGICFISQSLAVPAAPTGLTIAGFDSTQVYLTWNPNTESDLAGYNIFRRLDTTSYLQINDTLLTDTTYTDTSVSAGDSYQTYLYVVKAVDTTGSPSTISNGVSINFGLTTTVDSWSMFQNNLSRTGFTFASGVHPPLQLEWKLPVSYDINPSGPSGPSVVANRLYYGIGTSIFAVDNGVVTWVFTSSSSEFDAPKPTIDGDKVFMGSQGDNAMYAISTTDGSLIWRFQTGGWDRTSPIVVNNVVYFGSWDENLYAVSEDSGTLIWNRSIHADDNTPSYADGVIYFCDGGGWSGPTTIHAIDTTTGNDIWNYATGGGFENTLAVDHGLMYTGDALSNTVFCLTTSGSLVWQHTLGGVITSSPAVAYGKVFIASDDSNLYALDTGTGDIVWQYTTGAGIGSSVAVADCIVYFGSEDGSLYAVNAENGSLEWSYYAGSECAHPAVVDDAVYFMVKGAGIGGGAIINPSVSPTMQIYSIRHLKQQATAVKNWEFFE